MNVVLSTPLKQLQHLATTVARHRQALRVRGWVRAWFDELLGLLPPAVRSRLATDPAVHRVMWPLPRELAPGSATLVLPFTEVMAQTISLPAAATVDLQRVMAFEIDRYTPFSADQVYFAAQVTQRTADRALVQLVVVDRERLLQMVEHCRAKGVVVQAIDAVGTHGDSMGIDLLPHGLRPAPSRAARAHRVLALSCALLSVCLMLGMLERREALVERMRQEVAEQRQQMAELEAARRELTDTQGAAGYLDRLKAERPTLTLLLTELSRCLGDDTWLEQLEVRDSGDVSLSGQSRKASALINRVRDCHSVQNAHFQGVIQADPQSGKDRFSLAAQLKQEVPDEPTTQP